MESGKSRETRGSRGEMRETGETQETGRQGESGRYIGESGKTLGILLMQSQPLSTSYGGEGRDGIKLFSHTC